MAVTLYSFAKLCNSGRLSREIQNSAIVTAEDHIETVSSPAETKVYMKAELSEGDETLLGTLVTNHVNTPLAEDAAQLVTLDSPQDADGSPIYRPKTTKTGWHYEPRSIDFYTGLAESIYNRKHNGGTIAAGTDYADATLKFYDTADALLTQGGAETDEDYQIRLDSNCVKTVMDWQPTYDMDIIGATVMIVNPPVAPQKAYAWAIVAPDIPENYGGSVPYLGGGWNLRFFANPSVMSMDGRGVKTMAYDPVYNSNKIRTIWKHDAGLKIGVQILFEHFKA